MIGVIAEKSEENVVREFFELFKTPWAFYEEGETYDVVLVACDTPLDVEAKLLVVYGSAENAFDRRYHQQLRKIEALSTLQYADTPFPIYGECRALGTGDGALIRLQGTGEVVAARYDETIRQVIRVGFDLFQEIDALLVDGQRLEHAQIPTLEIHIDMIRNWIVAAGIPLVEVANCPAGFDFVVCLTHDVDFFRIRDHKLDRTMLGFLYRALCGSLMDFLQHRASLSKLLKNWCAAWLLPGVYVGLVKDYFLQFDRYLEAEKGLVSTFFIVPFKNRPGMDNTGHIQSARAIQYDLDDIKPAIETLVAAGREVALHGIDAWREGSRGEEERQRIAQVSGHPCSGVRSHWLYQNEQSPQNLEAAGFAYDSTLGYNETVGYRNGTTQVFRPRGATELLELPLNMMDTALFYPLRMHLTESEAMTLAQGVISSTKRYGGVLTLNWHHRSLGPERLWDRFYEELLAHLKRLNVWFATARQAVAWFRVRRSACFRRVDLQDDKLNICISSHVDDVPQLLLRIHMPVERTGGAKSGSDRTGQIVEIPFLGELKTAISIQQLEKINHD